MLLLVTAAWAYAPVERAAALHLSASGLDRLGQGIVGVMPTELPVGDMTGELVCDEAQPDVILSYALSGLSLGIHVDEVAIVPSAGRLDVTLYGTLDSTPATFVTSGGCSVLTELDETCAIEMPSTAFSAHIGLGLALVDGKIDATADELELELPPIGNPLDGCTLSSAIGTLLGRNESAITDILMAQVEPALADLGPTLETAIEDATAVLPMSTSFALGDATLELTLSATELEIDEGGLFIGMGAEVATPPQNDCVTAAEEPTSNDAWPSLDGTAPDGSLQYDAALALNAGFVDQLLHAVYNSGTLCVQGSDLGGFSLTTSIFSAAFGDAWAELFPETQPLTLDVHPLVPPTIAFSATGAPIRMKLNGLPVRGYADLDARQAKAFGLHLDGEIGVDIPYTDGSLVPGLILDPVMIGLSEEDNELLPVGYADGVVDILPTLIGAVLPDDLLPTVALPSWQGIGLAQIWWMPDSNTHWIGGYALLDVEHATPLELPGCEGGSIGCEDGGPSIDLESALGCNSDTGGCDSGCGSDSGCGTDSGGCSTVPMRPALFAFALATVALRRKR